MRNINKKGAIGPILLIVIFILGLVALGALLSGKVSFLNFAASKSGSQVIRGLANDFWADRVIGKRDFGEIGPNKIVPYKVFRPGGTVIDTSVTPGRLYVWDGGNSRILGIDLARCYGSTATCSADIIIGQPSGTDMGGCNNDSSFSSSPNRKPASASSLCGMPENTHTTLEDKSLVTMAVDSKGNLYAPDAFNHRILKFNSPFTTDTIADDFWGQPDFSSNGCNFTGDARSGLSGGPAPKPTANSLCFHSINGEGAAVAFDPAGNMWVADGGNNRLLRYPKSGSTISKTPDFVLGQPDFTTGGDWSGGSANNQFKSPQSLAFDKDGNLYVSDSGNNRVLKFTPPYSTGTTIVQKIPGGIITVVNDSQNRGIWTRSNNINTVLSLWSYSGQPITSVKVNNFGAGAFGFDTNNHILVSTYDDQDVFELIPGSGGTNYTVGKSLFLARNVANLPDPSRFHHPAWGGIAVTDNQLIVAVNHLRFWNTPPNIPNGKEPDGFVGVAYDTDRANPEFGELSSDQNGTLWATRLNLIEAYQTPLTTNAKPIKQLINQIDVLGGGSITLETAMGIAATPDGKYLWVSENEKSRVVRIRDPLTNPLIDVILGQTSPSGDQCNNGLVPARDPQIDLTMLCNPGMLSLDKKGNLYVSDHVIEARGNFRTLMFSATLFPDNLAQPIFGLKATKEFPSQGITQGWSHMNFEAAFDSSNRMVIGNNPYSGFKKRYLEYYNDPTAVNPANPSDPSYAEPTGTLNDFYGWPIGLVFDKNDNLYVYDANRGQVRIYFKPFGVAPKNQPPIAKFTGAPTSGRSPLTVKFTNQSLDPDNDILTYAWDFGDGQKSTDISPSHTYKVIQTPDNQKKLFTATLIATDSKGTKSNKATQTFSVAPNRPPIANFTYKINKIINGYSVQFNSTSTDPDNDSLSYQWDYGDDTTGKSKNNTHVYKKSGKYTVVLKVQDSFGAKGSVQKIVSLN